MFDELTFAGVVKPRPRPKQPKGDEERILELSKRVKWQHGALTRAYRNLDDIQEKLITAREARDEMKKMFAGLVEKRHEVDTQLAREHENVKKAHMALRAKHDELLVKHMELLKDYAELKEECDKLTVNRP